MMPMSASIGISLGMSGATNAKAFTADGWYASGDVVMRRPDGNLVVEGRDAIVLWGHRH